MEKFSTEELKAYLMESNEDFRRLAEEHAGYKRMIDEIEARPHVTTQDEIEEQRLKKLKLRVKDQMQQFIERYRAEHVA